MNTTELACAAVVGLLQLALGLSVSILSLSRWRVSCYAPDSDQLLTKLIRAHGNIPFLAVVRLHLGCQHPITGNSVAW